MSFRYLHTLENLGTAPEPNLTVLWSVRLPEKFKQFCARTSVRSSSIQYENDDLMRVTHGDDYAIACCVSSMRVGKEMQFFGARANLAKCLLYAINGGVDEVSKKQVGPAYRPILSDYLEYGEVMERFEAMMEWLAGVYVNALNIIHYMHDRYCYERIQMALHDRQVVRWFATGIAGLSVVTDSLSAIRYAKVRVLRDENGLAVDYKVEGEFPKYGNSDERADEIAGEVVHRFMQKIRKNHTYRDSIPTTSILTITSNVVYGKNTGATPDGRKAGEPFRRCQSHAQPGLLRSRGFFKFRFHTAFCGRSGRHFQHLFHCAGCPWKRKRRGGSGTGPGRKPGASAGRLYGKRRPSFKCQRIYQRNPFGCSETSGKISPAYHPGVRLCS